REEAAEIRRLRLEGAVAGGQRDPRLLAARPEMRRRPQPRGVVERSGPHRAHRRAGPWVAADPRAAVGADPAAAYPPAVGGPRDQPRLAGGEAKRRLGDDKPH